jgi:hypothetical protein
MSMLRRNPKLQVFALHDASIEGCALPLLLRTEPWFEETSVSVLDLGLRPRHAVARRMTILRGHPRAVSSELASLLTPSETAWLTKGHHAEVASIRPARLMRILAFGIAQAAQLREDAWIKGEEEVTMEGEEERVPEHPVWSMAGMLGTLAILLHLRDDPGQLEEGTGSIWEAEYGADLFSIDTFG